MGQEVRVSEIQIIPVKPKEGLIGFASFVLDKKYYVGSVAIYTRLNGTGYRLAYPAKKVGERQINTFYPITPLAGRVIEEAVSEKVNKIFNEQTYERTGPEA